MLLKIRLLTYDEEAPGRAQKESFPIDRAGFLKVRRHAHVREKSKVVRLVQEAIDLRQDTLHSHPPRERETRSKKARVGEGFRKSIFRSRPRTLISSMSMKMGI